MVKRTKTKPEEQQVRGGQFAEKNERNGKKTKDGCKGKGLSGRENQRNWDLNDQYQRVLETQLWEGIPVLPGYIELRTKYSQHIVRRVGDQFAVNCYLAEVLPATDSWKHWRDIIDAVGAVLDRVFDSVDQVFRESEDQSEHMIKILGITEMPHCMNTQQVKCAVTTPRVTQFLRYLNRLDDQVLRLDALWMAEGGIDRKYALTESMRLRKILGKVSGHVYRQSDRVRRVLRGHLTHHAMLAEVQDDLRRY